MQNNRVMSEGLTYRDAGVDIEEGERLVKLISPIVQETFRKEVLTGLGGFSGLFSLDTTRYPDPVLVSGADGVGTKLKIAFMADRHDTVGVDLVAMCVNDILTSGAEPLFFLDYFATGRLSADKARDVISGIARGCKDAGCALIGGETAEMPGFYPDGEYDLSGFAVGVVNRNSIIDGTGIAGSDRIIGLRSSGLHSNGFSLVRKLFFEVHKLSIDQQFDQLGKPLGEVLLEPTRIYVRGVLGLLRAGIPVNGMAHITGGGISGNLARILPGGCRAEISRDSLPRLPIFELISDLGKVDFAEMERTFNLGIGYIIIVPEAYSERALHVLNEDGYESSVIGMINKGGKGVFYVQD